MALCVLDNICLFNSLGIFLCDHPLKEALMAQKLLTLHEKVTNLFFVLGAIKTWRSVDYRWIVGNHATLLHEHLLHRLNVHVHLSEAEDLILFANWTVYATLILRIYYLHGLITAHETYFVAAIQWAGEPIRVIHFSLTKGTRVVLFHGWRI